MGTDSSAESANEFRIQNIKSIMSRIERRTKTGPDEQVGVVLHKNVEPEKKADKAANAVVDGLMMTLGVIGRNVGEYAQDAHNSIQAREYENVLHAIDVLAGVADAVVEGKIKFESNDKHEKKRASVGDSIRSYDASNVLIDGKVYKKVSVMIRPEKWDRKLTGDEKNERYNQVNVEELKEPRMKIMVHDESGSKVEIRADRGGNATEYQIMYDLVFGDSDEDLNSFDNLPLNDPQITAMRYEGHHFKSSLKEKDFHTTFPEIMRSMITYMDTLLVTR